MEWIRSDPCIDGLGASEKSLWLWAAGLLEPTEEEFWTDIVSDGCVPSLETTGRAGSAVLTEFGSDRASFAYGYGLISIMTPVVLFLRRIWPRGKCYSDRRVRCCLLIYDDMESRPEQKNRGL